MIPSAWDSGFSGAHIQPPDHEVAPPRTGAFSATTTFRPWWAAVTAPASPAAPPPTTRRSQSILRSCPVADIASPSVDPTRVRRVGQIRYAQINGLPLNGTETTARGPFAVGRVTAPDC